MHLTLMGFVQSFKNIFRTNSNSHLKFHLCNKTLSTEAEYDMHMKTVHNSLLGDSVIRICFIRANVLAATEF